MKGRGVRRRTKAAWLSVSALATALLWQTGASAWAPFYTYNQPFFPPVPVKWSGPQTIKWDNICTTADQASAMSRARNQWILVTSNSMLGSVVGANLGCAAHYGNNINELVFVPQSQLPDGALGVTSCRFVLSTYLECDVAMNNSALLYSNPVDEAKGSPVGRSVLVHELGHFQGLGHFEGLDQMKSGIPFFGPALTGGSDVADARQPPYGDDATGVRALYGSAPRTNVFASAQRWVSDFGGQIQTTNSDQLLNICRGGTISTPIFYTLVNNGTVAANNIGFKMYLATSPTATSGFDILIDSKTLLGGASTTYQLNSLTIPSNLPNGTYYIHWMIDTANQLSEYDETDNRVRSALRLNVTC